jgi:hypothetical protein
MVQSPYQIHSMNNSSTSFIDRDHELFIEITGKKSYYIELLLSTKGNFKVSCLPHNVMLNL